MWPFCVLVLAPFHNIAPSVKRGLGLLTVPGNLWEFHAGLGWGVQNAVWRRSLGPGVPHRALQGSGHAHQLATCSTRPFGFKHGVSFLTSATPVSGNRAFPFLYVLGGLGFPNPPRLGESGNCSCPRTGDREEQSTNGYQRRKCWQTHPCTGKSGQAPMTAVQSEIWEVPPPSNND